MKKLAVGLSLLTILCVSVVLAQNAPPPVRPDGQAQPMPVSSGINWQEITIFCVGVAAINGLITKYVVNPALDKRFGDYERSVNERFTGLDKRFLDFRKTIDDEFLRCPEREDELPITRRENSMLEEQAKREHAILKEKIDELARRLDHEFGKVWGVLKRLVNREKGEPPPAI